MILEKNFEKFNFAPKSAIFARTTDRPEIDGTVRRSLEANLKKTYIQVEVTENWSVVRN